MDSWRKIASLIDLKEKFKAIKQQPDVQQALQRSGDSYRDPHIRDVFAIAPAVARAFTPESLQKITIPVEIVAGASNPIAPPAQNAQFFAANIKGAKLTILPGGVDHYTFLDVGTDTGKKQLPQFFMDNPASIAKPCTSRSPKWQPNSSRQNSRRSTRNADHNPVIC